MDIDENLLTTCFSNILEKFTVNQANIMGNFAEVLAENQSKNMNRISSEIGKQLTINYRGNLEKNIKKCYFVAVRKIIKAR